MSTSTTMIDDLLSSVISNYLASGGSVAKANEISPNILEATYIVAYNQYNGGHYEEAAHIFQYLCIYDQWSSRYFLGLGSCQKMLRLYGQAIDTYSFAYGLDSYDPLPLIYRADCYLKLNKYDEAKLLYLESLQVAGWEKTKSKEVERVESMLSRMAVFNGEGMQ